MAGLDEPDRGGSTAGGREPDAPSSSSDGREPDRGPTPMRGVWVAIVIVGGAATVFLLLALSSGALNG